MAGRHCPARSVQWGEQAWPVWLVRAGEQGRRPRPWQAEPVQVPLRQLLAPPSHGLPFDRAEARGQMGEVPEQVEAAEQSVGAAHSWLVGAKVQEEEQQRPSDGEQGAAWVRVQGVAPPPPVLGTQQRARHRVASVPQSHSSQPSTTELPHTPRPAATRQQPRRPGSTTAMAATEQEDSAMLAGRRPRLPVAAIRCSPSGPGGHEAAVSWGAPKLWPT